MNAMQKEFYRNRYSTGDLTRSYIQKNATYSNPTKNYYYELDNALRERETKMVNPEALKENSSFKVTRKTDQLKGLDFMYAGNSHNNYNQQNSMLQSMKEKETKQKMDLKNALISQIKEKEESRKL